MINKNGKAIKKLGICLNVLFHYGKYKKLLGCKVRIIKNDSLSQYNKLIGEIGYVCDFEFINFSKPIIVYFPKLKKAYCFAIDEFEKI